MYIYLIFIIITVLIAALYDYTQKKWIYYLDIFIMSIFAGIRYKVGTDYENYEIMFKTSMTTDFKTYDGDKGFLLISKIISFFTNNTRIHFFIISSFIVILLMLFIFKNSKLKFLSVALFLGLGSYFTSFNIMRQYIAIAIIAHSINYIEEKGSKYYFYVIMASFFHVTAIIMISIKTLINLNWSKKVYITIGIIFLGIYVNVNYILSVIGAKRLDNYVDSYYTTEGANPIILLVYISILIFCFLNVKSFENKINNKFLKLMFIGVLIIFIGTKGLIFTRIASYFNISILICVPNAFLNLKKDEKKLIGYCILICLFFYSIIMLKTQGNLLPYRIS